MASDRQVLLRPVEYYKVGTSFTTQIDGGAVNTFTCDNGVYASILVLWRNVEKKIALGTLDCTMTSDFKCRMTYTGAGTDFKLTFNDATLQAALGFTSATYLTGKVHTAEKTPQYSWLSTYGRKDQEFFMLDPASEFQGTEMRSGRVPGLHIGAGIYRAAIEFPLEPAENVQISATTDAYQYLRSLEYFVNESRVAYPTRSGNPSPAGFYYVHDYEDTYNLYTDMTSGGVKWYTNEYAFCMFDEDPSFSPKSSLPRGRIRYEVGFSCHTATAPTWNATSA